MAIKPVDYVNIVSKSQEIAKLRQVEHDKVRVQMEQGIIQQEKLRENKRKKVMDTNKSENLMVELDKRNQSGNYHSKKKDKKKDKRNKKEDKWQIGNKVDIKI